ncbi:hypothetical protein HDU92_007288, partial [Lobulomyces angularis]
MVEKRTGLELNFGKLKTTELASKLKSINQTLKKTEQPTEELKILCLNLVEP